MAAIAWCRLIVQQQLAIDRFVGVDHYVDRYVADRVRGELKPVVE